VIEPQAPHTHLGKPLCFLKVHIAQRTHCPAAQAETGSARRLCAASAAGIAELQLLSAAVAAAQLRCKQTCTHASLCCRICAAHTSTQQQVTASDTAVQSSHCCALLCPAEVPAAAQKHAPHLGLVCLMHVHPELLPDLSHQRFLVALLRAGTAWGETRTVQAVPGSPAAL
jgi:hypothetical protein